MSAIAPSINKPGPAESQQPELAALEKNLDDKQVQASLDCNEGVDIKNPPHTVNEMHDFVEPLVDVSGNSLLESNTQEKAKAIIPDSAWISVYSIASALHAFAGLDRVFKFLPKSLGSFLDKNSPMISKTVNLFNYSDKGQVSLRDNNALDGISKLLFPAIVTWLPVGDMFLGAGLSSGTTMLASAHNPRISNKKSLGANLKEHMKIYGEMIKEIFSKGGIKKLLSKDDFHLMHLGGNMNFFGGLGGLIADGMHPVIKTWFSGVRNFGGIVCDVAKILHGDLNYLISGVLYITAHVLDIWQTAIARSDSEKSRTISHFVQSISTVANYFYTKPSETMANNTFKDRVRERYQVGQPQLTPVLA